MKVLTSLGYVLAQAEHPYLPGAGSSQQRGQGEKMLAFALHLLGDMHNTPAGHPPFVVGPEPTVAADTAVESLLKHTRVPEPCAGVDVAPCVAGNDMPLGAGDQAMALAHLECAQSPSTEDRRKAEYDLHGRWSELAPVVTSYVEGTRPFPASECPQ